jgi:hypothetical protein
MGSFDYFVNSQHEFYPGGFPPGVYQIEVRVGSVVGSVTFSVVPGTTTGGGPPG